MRLLRALGDGSVVRPCHPRFSAHGGDPECWPRETRLVGDVAANGSTGLPQDDGSTTYHGHLIKYLVFIKKKYKKPRSYKLPGYAPHSFHGLIYRTKSYS